MNETDIGVRTTLRIPGKWTHPGELMARVPDGFRLTPDALILPDGTEIEFTPIPPDGQFAEIFKSSCRQPASQDEMKIVDSYTVNVGLSGPGGSLQAAATMMQAGAAIVRAGGAGVFVDNSAVAHGGGHWLEMADDGSSDAMSFAFVGIVRGEFDVWTIGMHVLGLPDVLIRHQDCGVDGDAIIGVICHLCSGDKLIADGHMLADDAGPRFKAVAIKSDRFEAGSPMHNPFGHLKLVSIKDIAESN